MSTLMSITRNTFEPCDGVVLSYLEAGSGPALVLVPGWSQSAAEFSRQIEFFAVHYRVLALDHRGHGDSGHGRSAFRVSQLASDLHEFLGALALDNVVLLGHSMGCAVIWSYWDQFGGARIRQLVLADQPAALTRTPLWSEHDVAELGAPLTPDAVFQLAAGVAGPDGLDVTAGAVASMFSAAVPAEEQAWILAENLRTPRALAGRLFANEALSDWRDVIPKIGVPTLVTAGELSLHPVAGPAWVAAHIQGSRFRVFTAEERGSHLIFWENAELFNAVVLEFLTSTR